MVDVFSGSPRSYATQKGVDITMVKATQGTSYVNPYCDVDYQAAKKAGKLLGVYHYLSGGNPEAEARYFYKNIKGYLGEAVPAGDWEAGQNSSWGNTSYVRKFVDEFHKLSGVWPLIYVQASAINQVANCKNDCGLWVASYPSMNWHSWQVPNMIVKTSPWPTYTVWQFTGDSMDRNVVNTTKEGWKRLAKAQKNPSKVQKWEKKKGTFVLGQTLKIHKEAKIDSPAIAQLKKGDVIKYNATKKDDKRLWLRQPRSKGYGYIVGKDKYGKALGNFK